MPALASSRLALQIAVSACQPDLVPYVFDHAEVNIPLLYRHILRRAKQFPSVKRDAIVDEIRATFRVGS